VKTPKNKGKHGIAYVSMITDFSGLIKSLTFKLFIMKKELLQSITVCLALFSIASCKEAYKDYEPVYTNSGYILLKKKDFTDKNAFVNVKAYKEIPYMPAEVKLFIDTATAIRMIGYYDEKYASTADAPKYIDFDPSEVFSMVSGLNSATNKLRIYYSCYDTITANLRYKTAWRSFVNKQSLVLVPTENGTDMFSRDPINVGSPCPPVCNDYLTNPTDTFTGTRYLKIGEVKPRHKSK